PYTAEEVVAPYAKENRLIHLDHQPLPSRAGVLDILADLHDVLYPGYSRRQNLHFGNVEYYVGELVDGLHDKLTQQIARALRHEADCGAPVTDGGSENGVYRATDFEAAAQQKAIQFLNRLPDVRLVLEQ